MSFANDKHKADDLCAELGFKKNQVAGKINRLKEEGVIFKNGNFYYFRDKLLKYWVKYIFQPRLKDMEAIRSSAGNGSTRSSSHA